MTHHAKMMSAVRSLKQNLRTDPGVEGPLQWGTIASISTGGSFDTAGVYLDSASGQPGASITLGIPWMNGYKPTVGDVVMILRMGGAARTQRVILGPLETTNHGMTQGGVLDAISILLNGFLTLSTAQAIAETLSFPTIREAETLAVQPQYTSPNISGSSFASASATFVMMGLGSSVSITPQVTGRVKVEWGWGIQNGTNGKTAFTQAYYGSGTAPVAGAAAAGTQIPGQKLCGFVTGTFTYAQEFTAVVTGLTLGTAYWFDLGGDMNGGTTTWNNFTITVTEF